MHLSDAICKGEEEIFGFRSASEMLLNELNGAITFCWY